MQHRITSYGACLISASALVFSSGIFAKSPPPVEPEGSNRVEIQWVNPDDYSDIRPSNQSRSRFRERTFKQLEQHFESLATRLPEGQRLKLSVTNLDLAGQVWPAYMIGIGFGSDVRLIERVDIPRINFSYELSDVDGNVLRQGEEKLKDMAFLDRISPRYRNGALRYEKNMIQNWFVKHFELTSSQ